MTVVHQQRVRNQTTFAYLHPNTHARRHMKQPTDVNVSEVMFLRKSCGNLAALQRRHVTCTYKHVKCMCMGLLGWMTVVVVMYVCAVKFVTVLEVSRRRGRMCMKLDDSDGGCSARNTTI